MDDFARLKGITTRMIGECRLITEQSSNVSMVDAVNSVDSPRESFDGLKQCIIKEVYNNIGSKKKMKEIIKRSKKEQGSLGELLFSEDSDFPKQIIKIRFGIAIETGIRNYITSKYEDVSDELNLLIKRFLDRNIQLDLAVRKDNTYFISEFKSNFRLDTEKTAKVVEKLDLFNIILKKFYGRAGSDTNVSLVSLRYPHADDIIRLSPGFKSIKSQYILGYTDFFKFFDLNVTKEEWETFLEISGQELLTLYSSVLEEESEMVQFAN